MPEIIGSSRDREAVDRRIQSALCAFYKELKQSLIGRTGPAIVNCRVSSPGISGTYWMADPSIGGAILGEAVHFVDLMYWLLESEPISVTAYCLPTGKGDPIGENNLVASFSFADGSIGV